MTKANELKKQVKDAKEYIGYIGRVQNHLKSAGKLSSLSVNTEINYQHNTGTTNYWKDKNFDAALSKVISQRFSELAKQAIELMEADAKAAIVAEKEALLERLAEIERIEKENSID